MRASEFEPDREVRAAVDIFQRGDAAAAEARCREILARAPDHRDTRVLLGMALQIQQRFGEAEVIFAELTRREPQQVAHWANLGSARRGARRFDEALQAYARAMQIGPVSANLLYSVGLTHLDRVDFESARAVFARAVEQAPQDAEIRYRYAHACFSALESGEAQLALQGWEELHDLTPELLADIGLLLMNLGDSGGAELALQQAALDPAASAQTILTLVQAYERSNRLTQAKAHIERLRQQRPTGLIADDLALAQARIAQREGQHEQALQLLGHALSAVTDLPMRHFQLFPLARSLDALGRADEAFAALVEAHQSQAAYIRMSAPTVSLRETPIMAATQFNVEPQDVANWNSSAGPISAESPIFVLGFPRSGTTLLELTLDAHPQLVSMDEQPFLQGALLDLQPLAPYPQGLAELTQAQLEGVRARYWQRVRQRVRMAPGQRLVDKNPLNILRLPVIRRLFPNAHILMAVRHPCDVLLSCYMQHFRAPEFALLCRDLATLAVGYVRVFDYWYRESAVLKPAVHEISYERLVADFATEVRAISDFLQLPWDERMLGTAAHAQAKGFISTPSYSQVIQPVNSRSVGRWGAYRKHFEPILPRLEPYLTRWNYPA